MYTCRGEWGKFCKASSRVNSKNRIIVEARAEPKTAIQQYIHSFTYGMSNIRKASNSSIFTAYTYKIEICLTHGCI